MSTLNQTKTQYALPGTNLYDEHYLMVDSGTFWRCRHGKTGFAGECWRCGFFHPFRLIRNWWGNHV
jgi:hypothetical protein